ncbi:recombinase RecB [Cyanobacteria bacterium FACHB-502]|nr:recombinase RecB [Cyanobacteria bacterium FACHB-502]
MLQTNVALRKTGNGWEFASEAVLEDFIWANLNQLFSLDPLARQLGINGEICDIVAVSSDRSLTILELKNTEDRYVVQQLTRYYANMLEVKPFQDRVDYDKPVRLIALAPSFHRHNLIDRKFNKLLIEFLVVKVIQENDTFLLCLTEGENQYRKIVILYQETDLSHLFDNVPPPPRRLLDSLGACTPSEQEQMLKVRAKLMTFHPQIQEIVETASITYGAGQKKLCAEIRFSRNPLKPVLFLWLPGPNLLTNRRQIVGRMRLWSNGQDITHIGYVPEGMGTMKLLAEWRTKLQPESEKLREHEVIFDFGNDRYMAGKHVMQMRLRRDGALNSHIPLEIEKYFRSLPEFIEDATQTILWDLLTDLALEYWLKRL